MSSQPPNQAQFMAVIPVSKYKQVTSPINGINDQFLINVPIARIKQIIQKIIADTLYVKVAVSVLNTNKLLKYWLTLK